MTELAKFLKVEEPNESQATTNSHEISSPVLGPSSPILSSHPDAMPLQSQQSTPRQATTAPLSDEAGRGETGPQKCDNDRQHHHVIDLTLDSSDADQDAVAEQRTRIPSKRNFVDFNEAQSLVQPSTEGTIGEDDMHLLDSQESSISARALETRKNAFDAVLQSSDSAAWVGLLSTTNNHTHPEPELGEG